MIERFFNDMKRNNVHAQWRSDQFLPRRVDLFGNHIKDTAGFGIHILWWVCISLVCIGVIVRTTNYFLADLSLWNDEAAVALNIVHKSFLEIIGPLEYNQVAPIGFCLFTKFSASIFGETEMAFRLLSYLAGTAAIGLAFVLINNAAGLWPALLCAAQLAVVKEPIFFSNNLKPYASDLAIAIALILVAWKSHGLYSSCKRLALITISGVVAIWFSFPAIFILGGVGLMWFMEWLEKPTKKSFCIIAVICAIWLLNFWLQFRLLQSQANNAYLLEFWSDNFLPIIPKSLSDLKFFFELPHVFRDPLWTAFPVVSSFLFIGGCLIIWRQDRRLLVLILFPLVLNLAASGLKKYPFGERMLQYGTMNLFMPISIALVFLLAWFSEKKWQKTIITLLIILNLAEPAVNAAKHIFVPKKIEQVKQVVEQLTARDLSEQSLYIFGTSYTTYKYYFEQKELKPHSVVVGTGIRDPDSVNPKNQIELLNGEYWLLFGHAKQSKGYNYENAYIQAANRRGQQLGKIIDVGASAYLYSFPPRISTSGR